MSLILKVKQVEELGPVDYATQGSAGIDLKASGKWMVDLDNKGREIKADSYKLSRLERVLVYSGISVEIPAGYYGNIGDRSGHSLRHGLHVMAGRVDSDYRGEVGILVVNLGKKPYTIKKGERIAQMVVTACASAEIIYAKELSQTERGERGFGSTGKH